MACILLLSIWPASFMLQNKITCVIILLLGGDKYVAYLRRQLFPEPLLVMSRLLLVNVIVDCIFWGNLSVIPSLRNKCLPR
jgi:hypothetical protein